MIITIIIIIIIIIIVVVFVVVVVAAIADAAVVLHHCHTQLQKSINHLLLLIHAGLTFLHLETLRGV